MIGHFPFQKEAILSYQGMEQILRRLGLVRSKSMTPLEYAKKVKSGFPELSKEVESLTQIYQNSLYGEVPPSEVDKKALREDIQSLQEKVK